MGNIIKSAGFGFVKSFLEEFFEEVTSDRIELSIVRNKSLTLLNLQLKVDVINVLLQGLPTPSPYALQAGYIKQVVARGDGGISDFLSNGKVNVEVDGLCLVFEPSSSTIGDVEAIMIARKLLLELQDRLANAYYVAAKNIKRWRFQLESDHGRNQIRKNGSYNSILSGSEEEGPLKSLKVSQSKNSDEQKQTSETNNSSPSSSSSVPTKDGKSKKESDGYHETIRPWPLRMLSIKLKNTHIRIEWAFRNAYSSTPQKKQTKLKKDGRAVTPVTQSSIPLLYCSALDLTIDSIILANCSSTKILKLGKVLSDLVQKKAQMNLDNTEEAVWPKTISIYQLSLNVEPSTKSFKCGRNDIEDLPGKYLQAVIESLETANTENCHEENQANDDIIEENNLPSSILISATKQAMNNADKGKCDETKTPSSSQTRTESPSSTSPLSRAKKRFSTATNVTTSNKSDNNNSNYNSNETKGRAMKIFGKKKIKNTPFLKPLNLILDVVFYFTNNKYTSHFKGVETKLSALQLSTTNLILKSNLKQLEVLQNFLADLLRSMKRNDYALLHPMQLYMDFRDNLDVLPPELRFYSNDPSLVIVPNMVYKGQGVINYLTIKRDKQERKGSQMYIKDLLKEKLGPSKWIRGMWKYVFSCIKRDLAASRPYARWFAVLKLMKKSQRYCELYPRMLMMDVSHAILQREFPFDKDIKSYEPLSKAELKEIFMLETVYINTDSILFLRAKCRLNLYLLRAGNKATNEHKRRNSNSQTNLQSLPESSISSPSQSPKLTNRFLALRSLCYTLSLSIAIKERSHFFSRYSDAFLGSDAISYFVQNSFELEGYLLKYPPYQTIKNSFNDGNLSLTDSAIYLLGEMLENGLIIDAIDKKCSRFHNSPSKFYQFTNLIENVSSDREEQDSTITMQEKRSIGRDRVLSNLESTLSTSPSYSQEEENSGELNVDYEMDIERVWSLFYLECKADLQRELNPTYLFEIAFQMREQVKLKDRSKGFKSYKETFFGADAVRWMRLEAGHSTITKSVAVLDVLIDRNYLHHVTRQYSMQNNRLLYVFSEEFKEVCNQTERYHGEMNPLSQLLSMSSSSSSTSFFNPFISGAGDAENSYDEIDIKNDNSKNKTPSYLWSSLKTPRKQEIYPNHMLREGRGLSRFSTVLAKTKEDQNILNFRLKYESKANADLVRQIAHDIHNNIRVKDRYFHLIHYKKCFKSSHAVTWLLGNITDVATEDMAIILLTIMMDQYNLFVPLSPNAATIANKRLLYRFLLDEKEVDKDDINEIWSREAEDNFERNISSTTRKLREENAKMAVNKKEVNLSTKVENITTTNINRKENLPRSNVVVTDGNNSISDNNHSSVEAFEDDLIAALRYSLSEIEEQLRKTLRTQGKKYHGILYEAVFVSSEAIAFMVMNEIVDSPEEALYVLNTLINEGFVGSLALHPEGARDGYQLLYFTKYQNLPQRQKDKFLYHQLQQFSQHNLSSLLPLIDIEIINMNISNLAIELSFADGTEEKENNQEEAEKEVEEEEGEEQGAEDKVADGKNQKEGSEKILEVWFGPVAATLIVDPVTISYPTKYKEKFSLKEKGLFSGDSFYIPPVLSFIIDDCQMHFIDSHSAMVSSSSSIGEYDQENDEVKQRGKIEDVHHQGELKDVVSLASKPLVGKMRESYQGFFKNQSWRWLKKKKHYVSLDICLSSTVFGKDQENDYEKTNSNFATTTDNARDKNNTKVTNTITNAKAKAIREREIIQNGSHNFDLPYLDITLYHKGQKFMTDESTVTYILALWKLTTQILTELNFDDQFDFYPRLFVPILPQSMAKSSKGTSEIDADTETTVKDTILKDSASSQSCNGSIHSAKAKATNAMISDPSHLFTRNLELPSVKERVRHTKYMIQYLLSQFTIPGGVSIFIQSEGIKWNHKYTDTTRRDEYKFDIQQQQVLFQISESHSTSDSVMMIEKLENRRAPFTNNESKNQNQKQQKNKRNTESSMKSSVYLMHNNHRLFSGDIVASRNAAFLSKGKDDFISWLAETLSVESSLFPTWTEIWRGN